MSRYQDLFDLLSANEKEDLADIAEKIRAGKVILFLGAAIHCPPPLEFEDDYPKAKRPPLGGELANILSGRFVQTFGKNPNSLNDIITHYAEKGWEPAKLQELKEMLTNRESKLIKGDGPILERIKSFYQEKKLPENEITELIEFLAKEMIETLQYEPHSLSWMAQYYELRRDRPQLISAIKDALSDKDHSPLLSMLAEMNFRYVITTNYDNLYEKALTTCGKTVKKGIYKPEKHLDEDGYRSQLQTNTLASFLQQGVAEAEMVVAPIRTTTEDYYDSLQENECFVYKVHGDIDHVFKPNGTYNEDNDAIVITDEDYIHFILRMGEKSSPDEEKNYNPIPASFARALSNPSEGITVLFIGYSLMDYNLRLLFKSALWKKRIKAQLRKWSVDINPDDTIKEIYSKNYTLTFIEKNAWAVIPYLYEQYKTL